MTTITGTDSGELIDGTIADDNISALDGNDTIYAGAGVDQISAGAGDDYIVGGQGDDYLIGGAGNNTYVFSVGDGSDTVYANGGTYATVEFTDIASTGLISVIDENNNLVLLYGNGDQVSIYKYFSNSFNKVNQFVFNDATLTADQLLEQYTLTLQPAIDGSGETVTMTNGANTVQGSTSSDSIDGMGGDDIIYGDHGSDIIDGGAGNDSLYGDAVNAVADGSADTLSGGGGTNVYYFSSGFGQDTVISTSGSDIVVFTNIASNSVYSDVRAGTSNNDRILSFDSKGVNTLTLQDYYLDAQHAVADIIYSDTINHAPSGTDNSINVLSGTTHVFITSDFGFSDAADPRPDLLQAVIIVSIPAAGTLALNGQNVTAGQSVSATDIEAGLLIYTPPINANGNDYASFTFQVLDNGGTLNNGIDLDQTANTISISGNYAPTVNLAIPDRTEQVGKTFSYQIPANTFSDQENDTLTYTAQLVDGSGNPVNNGTLPAWLSFDAATRTLSGKPDNNPVTIRITATDTAHNNSAYDDFVIDVNHSVNATDTVAIIKDSLAGQPGNYDEIFDGGAGADRMSGGGGNDTYWVDNTGDSVVELANKGNASYGIDEIRSSVSYTLSANVENLILTGSSSINGTGNTLVNLLIGNDGNNILDGGAGIDQYAGGKGDDIYIIDDLSETAITEASNGGNDTIKLKVNTNGAYVLGNNIENAMVIGTGIIDLSGNDGNNQLTGNAKSNTLTGGAGDDRLSGAGGMDIMKGGSGNDTYVVDNVLDTVDEEGNSDAADWISASINISLASYTGIENITFTGNAALKAYGNAGNNILMGNNGNNWLDGGSGADDLDGGKGNDTYIVDSADDSVTELANGGTDVIYSRVTYTLSDNIENITLSGPKNINATGNALKNTLIGNDGNNVLDGGSEIDSLKGGLGDDSYIVDLIKNGNVVKLQDTITEMASQGTDTLALRAGNLGLSTAATLTLSANLEKIDIQLTDGNLLNIIGNTANNSLIGNNVSNKLDGGLGNDILTGGAGNDYFAFSKPLNGSTNVDTITDFTTGDIIQLSKAIFGTLGAAGVLTADYFTVGSSAQDANDHIIFDSASGNLFYDKDGIGGAAQVQFGIINLTGGHTLSNADFLVF